MDQQQDKSYVLLTGLSVHVKDVEAAKA